MNTTHPIHLRDIRTASVRAISRAEAERQFKFSLALVILFVVGTLIAVSALPVSGWNNGYGTTAVQLAGN
jgi:hypothetical protein